MIWWYNSGLVGWLGVVRGRCLVLVFGRRMVVDICSGDIMGLVFGLCYIVGLVLGCCFVVGLVLGFVVGDIIGCGDVVGLVNSGCDVLWLVDGNLREGKYKHLMKFSAGIH